jgi:hypothetical protein
MNKQMMQGIANLNNLVPSSADQCKVQLEGAISSALSRMAQYTAMGANAGNSVGGQQRQSTEAAVNRCSQQRRQQGVDNGDDGWRRLTKAAVMEVQSGKGTW